MFTCQFCLELYERIKGVPSSRLFCSRDCYYASLKVPLALVYQRDRGICHICHQHVPYDRASRDHLKPRSEGGKTVWHNIALAHGSCNSSRGSKPLVEGQLLKLDRHFGVADALGLK